MLIPTGYCLAKYRFISSGDVDEMIMTCGHQVAALDGVPLANALDDAYRDSFLPSFLGSSYTWMGVDISVGTNLGGASPFFEYSSSVGILGGSGTSAQVPSNCATLVHKQTDEPGRRGKGRLYQPGFLGDTDVDNNGAIAGARLTALQTGFTAWFNRCNADGLDMAVFHTESPAEPANVVSLVVDPKIGTQRRRMR